MTFTGFNPDSQESRLHHHDSLVNRKGSGLRMEAPKRYPMKPDVRSKLSLAKMTVTEHAASATDEANGRIHSVKGVFMTPDHPQWQRLPEHVQAKLMAQLGLSV